jgi:HSP20 family protein
MTVAKNRMGPAMHNEVDKLFLELLRGERAPRYGRAAFRPSADVYYDAREDAVIVKLELPGIDPGCVRLEVENNVLTVSGSRSDERHPEAVYQQMEITYGRFERSISLPPEVEAEKATADYAAGYLKIVIPVKKRLPAKRIAISVKDDIEGGPQS